MKDSVQQTLEAIQNPGLVVHVVPHLRLFNTMKGKK